MKIIAFGASSSSTSINKQLAVYAANQLKNQHQVEILDLQDFELPLYSIDLEKKIGIPAPALQFQQKLDSADLIIVSLAEHNGSYTAVFKNLFDWISRHKVKCFADKKMILLATSPGGRGGMSVLETAKLRFPSHGAEVIAAFSLPFFSKNFSEQDGITDAELAQKFKHVLDLVG
ncbi:MAG: NADPH-dependent oxidoreductase [Cytophagales bacterium]|nr:MAG: NADPH-dependent oxidoreductase [Cytophagales bacterium]TAF59610.1 MAG: NADPH-dependent oxidoreductase [Cytophagales bacterium]